MLHNPSKHSTVYKKTEDDHSLFTFLSVNSVSYTHLTLPTKA